MTVYSAFFRGEKYEDGIMVRVEADSLPEAVKMAEESRQENGVALTDLHLHNVVEGYGSPSMF